MEKVSIRLALEKPSTSDKHERSNATVKSHYRKGTCVKNRSGKDTLYADKVFIITNTYFVKRKLKFPVMPLGIKMVLILI